MKNQVTPNRNELLVHRSLTFRFSRGRCICTHESAIDDINLHVEPTISRRVHRLALDADIEVFSPLFRTRAWHKLQPVRVVDDLPPKTPSLHSPRQASRNAHIAGSFSLRAMNGSLVSKTSDSTDHVRVRIVTSRVVHAKSPDARSFAASLWFFLNSRNAHAHFGNVLVRCEHDRLVPVTRACEPSRVRPVFGSASGTIGPATHLDSSASQTSSPHLHVHGVHLAPCRL